MAPSRALLRTAASVHFLATRRTLSASCRMNTRPSVPVSVSSVRPSHLRLCPSRALHASSRLCSQTDAKPTPPDHLSEGELHIFNKIVTELEPVKLEVQDISGGCGSMYGIEIESEKFKGLSVIKQHKLVNSVLADEIKSWHGMQLRTRAP